MDQTKNIFPSSRLVAALLTDLLLSASGQFFLIHGLEIALFCPRDYISNSSKVKFVLPTASNPFIESWISVKDPLRTPSMEGRKIKIPSRS